jgi:hypothetical protein
VTEEFRAAGGVADYRLVFTSDRQQTVTRVADEVGARAYAITGITDAVERHLVSLCGDVAADRILDFVVELVGDRDADDHRRLGTAHDKSSPGSGPGPAIRVRRTERRRERR